MIGRFVLRMTLSIGTIFKATSGNGTLILLAAATLGSFVSARSPGIALGIPQYRRLDSSGRDPAILTCLSIFKEIT